jgi:hypothetical protein
MIWVGCHSDNCDEEPMTDGDYLTIDEAIADWDRLFGAPNAQPQKYKPTP